MNRRGDVGAGETADAARIQDGMLERRFRKNIDLMLFLAILIAAVLIMIFGMAVVGPDRVEAWPVAHRVLYGEHAVTARDGDKLQLAFVARSGWGGTHVEGKQASRTETEGVSTTAGRGAY